MSHPAPGPGEPSPVPLSFAQQRLWFLDQLEPNLPLYNTPFALRLTGRLDLSALQRSLDTIVARHEALRTTFPATDGRPQQVVSPQAGVDLRIIGLSNIPVLEREAAALRMVDEEAARPFDLARGPMLRAQLLRLSSEDHLLVLVQHHIVTDGWSLSVLFDELSHCYSAYRSGGTPRLPELEMQYPDYAVWQQAWLQGEQLEQQLGYWRSRLAGVPPVLELPTDHPRPSVQTYRGADQERFLAGLSTGLTAVARQERATLFVVLLAAFQVLLARYTGRTDIVVGAPIAGRTNPKWEKLIGLFVNTLALRTDLSGNPTFRELLGRVREVAFGAYAHQGLPFERLVEALQPERSRQHAPLVQVLLALENMPAAQLELPGLQVRTLRIVGRMAKFDLSLLVRPSGDSLVARIAYSTDLFEPRTIGRLLDHLETLLKGIVAEPGRRLSALPLLTNAERRRLLREWNPSDDRSPRPPVRCAHELVSEQAARIPEAPALVFGEGRLTFRQLDENANRLAHRLREAGVKSESRVGLAVARSPNLVLGLLAILKAGGTYVPLDPAYPPERVRFLIADSGAALVVDDAWLARERDAIAGQPADAPAVTVHPEQLAYVIYTSGSTGEPRGAAISHEALGRHCPSVARCYGLRATDQVLQFSAASWDASIEQMLATLVVGATVVLRGPEVWTASEFRREVLGAGVTLANLPTAYVDQLVREWAVSPELAPAGGMFRQLVVGGEALSPATAGLWQASPLGSVPILNAYGPTEATITSVAFALPSRIDPAASSVPIGRPLDGRTAYILDRHLNPVPVGIPGELYLGGDSLARGYLGQPRLTAERFIPDPFGSTPGARLYRTGDLVRYLEGGEIDFLGRVDQQIKLRGYRIEPGEIEVALEQHPDVHHSVVLLREDTPGDRRLVAYLMPAERSEGRPTVGELREYLGGLLPAYMVPSAFVWLDSLPLTPQGKINRSALPAPDGEIGDGTCTPVSPRTAVEEELAGIWCEVLGRLGIGVNDNFFALGGHSLLATQIVSRVRSRIGVELPLIAVFQAPTIASLAKEIEAARQGDQAATPLKPAHG